MQIKLECEYKIKEQLQLKYQTIIHLTDAETKTESPENDTKKWNQMTQKVPKPKKKTRQTNKQACKKHKRKPQAIQVRQTKDTRDKSTAPKEIMIDNKLGNNSKSSM